MDFYETYHQPHAIHNVVLPLDSVQCDGVNVLVEPQSKVHHEEHQSQTLCTEVVWQDLCAISDQKSRPCHVVEDVVDEYHGDDRVCCGLRSAIGKGAGTCCPDNETAEHTRGRDQEESASANQVDHETLTDGDKHVHDLNATIDEQLGVVIRDANIRQNDVQVVRGQAVSRPLREETECEQNQESAAVALALDEYQPAISFELLLKGDGLFDLLELKLDQFIIVVAVGVSLREDTVGLFGLALGDQESWTLRYEPDKAELDDWCESLEDGRNSPRPVAVIN